MSPHFPYIPLDVIGWCPLDLFQHILNSTLYFISKIVSYKSREFIFLNFALGYVVAFWYMTSDITNRKISSLSIILKNVSILLNPVSKLWRTGRGRKRKVYVIKLTLGAINPTRYLLQDRSYKINIVLHPKQLMQIPFFRFKLLVFYYIHQPFQLSTPSGKTEFCQHHLLIP